MIAKRNARLQPLSIAGYHGEGALWFDRKVLVSPRFEFGLTITINKNGCDDPESFAIDGFTIILTSSKNSIQGGPFGAIGYNQLYDGIVTEFDLFLNQEYGDLSANTMSIHRCFKSACTPTETNTLQKKLPIKYDKCREMTYNVDLIYNNKQFNIYLGDTLLGSVTEDLEARFIGGIAFLGLSGSVRGFRRELLVTTSYICEDDFVNTDFIHEWVQKGKSDGINTNAIIAANSEAQINLTFIDSAGFPVSHTNKSIWDWTASLSAGCGTITDLNPIDDFKLQATLSGCKIAGSYILTTTTHKGVGKSIPYTITAKSFAILSLIGYSNTAFSEASITKTDSTDGYLKFAWGTINGDFTYDSFKTSLSFDFDVQSTDEFGNIIDLGTDMNLLAPVFGMSASVGTANVNPVYSYISFGKYEISIPITTVGTYYVKSTKFSSVAAKRFKFVIFPGTILTINSICKLDAYTSTPTLDRDIQVSITCQISDAVGNSINPIIAQSNYGSQFGCTLVRFSYLGLKTSTTLPAVITTSNFSCLVTTSLSGKWTLKPFFKDPSGIVNYTPNLLNSYYVQPTPSSIGNAQIYDFSTSKLTSLVRNSSTVAYVATATALTLIELMDVDNTPYSAIGYPNSFNLSSLGGSISNVHNSAVSATVRLSYIKLNNINYVGVFINDKTFIKKASDKYQIKITFKEETINVLMTSPAGNTYGRLVCDHALSLPNTQWIPTSTTGSLSTFVNTDLVVGQIVLQTSDNYLYNYKYSKKDEMVVNVSPPDVSTNAYLTEDLNVDGFYNVRIFTKKSNTYNISVVISGITAFFNYKVLIQSNPVMIKVNATSFNTYDTTQGSVTDKYISSVYTDDNLPTFWVNSSDEFDNLLTNPPNVSNNYLGAEITLTINGNAVAINFDDTSILFTYDQFKQAYSIVDLLKIPGSYVLSITTLQKDTVNFYYSKITGEVSNITSSATVISNKDLKISQAATILVTLKDLFGSNIASNDALANYASGLFTITATAQDSSVSTFAFQDITGLAFRLSTAKLMLASTYTISISYNDPNSPSGVLAKTIPCSNCVFYVNYDQFDMLTCTISAILSSTVQMSQNSILRVNNSVDKPLFNFNFFDSNNNQLQYIDKSSKLSASFIGNGIKQVLNLEWIGNNQILWTFPNLYNLSNIVKGNYNLIILYKNASAQTYPIQFLGDGQDSDAGNGDPSFDLTVFSTTNLRPVAGISSNFNIEFRTTDNLRVNDYGDITKFIFTNSFNYNANTFKASVQVGAKKGNYIISVISTVSSSSKSPIVLSIFYKGTQLKQTVNVIVKCSDLKKLNLDNTYIVDNQSGILKNITSTDTYSLTFTAIDTLGNNFDDLYNPNIFSTDRIVRLFNVQHSNNAQVLTSVTTNPVTNNFILRINVNIVGTVSISSSFVPLTWTFIVFPGELSNQTTDGLFINQDPNFIAGNTISYFIIPKDINGNLITSDKLTDLNFSSLNMKIDLAIGVILTRPITPPVKIKNINGSIEFQTKLTQTGIYTFSCYMNGKLIGTKSLLKVNIAPIVFENSKLTLSGKELSASVPSSLDVTNVPTLIVTLRDQYSNLYQNIPGDFILTTSFTGYSSNINLCSSVYNGQIDITVCQTTNDRKNWGYLVNKNGYTFSINNGEKTLAYSINLVGGGNNSDASNGPIDVSKTFFDSSVISAFAGTLAKFQIELRTTDGKRKNYWYDNPTDMIKLSFVKASNIYITNVIMGAKPGQYIIKASSINPSPATDKNLITLTIENIACVINTVQLIVTPNTPVSAVFRNNSGVIGKGQLPIGNADNDYVLALNLYDTYGNLIDADANMFGYTITPPANKQVRISSQIIKNNDSSLTLTISPIYSGTYGITSVLLRDTYTFSVTPGALNALNSLVKAPTTATAGDNLKIYVIPYDANNNYIDPKTLANTNQFNAAYKYKNILTGNYVDYVSISNYSLEIYPGSDMGCNNCNAYAYPMQVRVRDQNYFRVTLGATTEINCVNCVTNVTPAAMIFSKSDFKRYYSVSGKFISLQGNDNEDNVATDLIYRIYPKDDFSNVIDFINSPANYSFTLLDENNKIYTTKNNSPSNAPKQFIEFVKNDNISINKDLVYNYLTGGAYTATFSNGSTTVIKTIVLIGRPGDNVASNADINEQNTVINESNLIFNAGQNGNMLIELRTVSNLRKSNWNIPVAVSYRILDRAGNALTGVNGTDASFASTVRNAGVPGVFYATVSTTLATTTLNGRQLVLQITVNGKIVTKLVPVVTVSPSTMTKANILPLYLKTGSLSTLQDGNSDSDRFFKVAAFDVYNNPTNFDLLALKITAFGPDKNAVLITPGREVSTGYATFTIDNKLAGAYIIGSNSGFLLNYNFNNNFGALVTQNCPIFLNDKVLIAGNKATLSFTPMDRYNNIITPSTLPLASFIVQVTSLSGKVFSTTGTASRNNLVFSVILTEKGLNTWKILFNNQQLTCNNCETNVSPNDVLTANSVVYCLNEGQVIQSYPTLSKLYSNINTPISLTVSLYDEYKNLIDVVPTDVMIQNAQMSGNNMANLPFVVVTSPNKRKFIVYLSDSNISTYNHLVSGIYNFSFDVKSKSGSSKFTYTINLTSPVIDTAYGNGNYVVEQTEVSNSFVSIFAGDTFTFNLKLKNAFGLYYNNEINTATDLNYLITPSDSSFKFKIYKKGSNYADYNIDIFSSVSLTNAQLILTINIRDPANPTAFKSVPTKVAVSIRPRLPPDTSKTLVVVQPDNTITQSTKIDIQFKLFDQFANLYVKETDVVNKIFLTNNDVKVTNTNIVLKSDGVTYDVSFNPTYPPRELIINIYYKDSVQLVSILPSPIITTVVSQPFFSNTIITGKNLNEMIAGSKLNLNVGFYDINNICIDNINNIPSLATVSGPLELDATKRNKFQYNFNLVTTASTDPTICINKLAINIQDNQIYNAAGSYNVVVTVGNSNFIAKSFLQYVVADVLDSKKFVSKYTMDGTFNPDRAIAGTQILFTVQANDKFMNPSTTSILSKTIVKVSTNTGKLAISNLDNNTRYDYAVQLTETRNGKVNGSFKFITANSYLVEYIYDGKTLSIDASRGPFGITVVPQSCSSLNASVSIDQNTIANTNSVTSFNINCIDSLGNKISTGGEPFSIILNLTLQSTNTSSSIKTFLTDNRDGTYTVMFVPPLAAKYNLLVNLNGNVFYNTKFDVIDSLCPVETPNRCPNNFDKCVLDLTECIVNSGSCEQSQPFYCKVNQVPTCVKSQTDCDCPPEMTKCFPNICVPSDKYYLCSFSLPVNCPKQFPNAKVLCADGICRNNIDDSPTQKVCPIGFFLCPDLTCRDDYSNCATYDDCPQKIRCSDQSCVLDQKSCPSSITCPTPGMYVCPDGTCVTSEIYCKPLPNCFAPNLILCSDNSCVYNIKNCPKQVSCGQGMALCNDITCKTSCLNK